ncbi:polyhydroxyalkanoate synthesis regulator DNA-binding domain-containing protein [Polyangium sp. y55x31]|uniref:polyhydroxyalkanoate synthesis regulator DNA-binding domain-containing protein n=1 Tax=Polyangium sp. y55x31 TaxID=3042688 RepID=UPI0024822682|nr:polyhydroxyalkanoate synthesis regulator DNA-binding domain-containing protein [Polyangium sp. y55x31]MDI1482256.1 polyhydroxyalkanoate synthesis regulator DNA-binding domain-containing protein [Polyangium sp. y55x31]
MDTVKETSGASATPRRVIKRYSNRKLYDTKDSRYVTLQQIGEMVRAGEEVQIIDNATKEDKTEVTLALIISEDLKSQPRSVPLGTLRDLIQERGERLLNTLREGPIGRLIPGGGPEDAPAEAAPAPAAAEKPPTQPPPAPAAAPTEADKPAAAQGAKARLSEIVESSKQTLDQWQHAVDERIRHILPGVGLFRDLQADVQRLSQRVEELEALVRKLGGDPANTSETPSQPETTAEE